MLSAEELLAGSGLTFEVSIPAEILRPTDGADGDERTVRLRPLTVCDLQLISRAAEKIPELRSILPPRVAIEVDGGVSRDNIRDLVEKGANWAVTGSALFGAENLAAEARILQDLMVARPVV